jgi:hypothetical protein
MTTAVANLKDTWSTINKNTSSSASAIIYTWIDQPMEEIFTTSAEQENFANFYSRVKKDLLGNLNQDYNFATFQGTVLKGTNSEGKDFYYPPTNFIRFKNTDWDFLNIYRKLGNNIWGQSMFGCFNYIGYIKDSNEELAIPEEFYELLGYELLQKHPLLKQKIINSQFDIISNILKAKQNLINLNL